MDKIETNEDEHFLLKCCDRLLLVICFTGAIGILVWLLMCSHYGFDFTDEGFYLTWISNPFIYDWSVYLFGFVYYPVYRVLGGDIVGLRQFNILMTFGLAWVVAFGVLAKAGPSGTDRPWRNGLIASGFSTASLVFFYTWLPTPSYNSLALQSLLLVAIGLLLVESIPTRQSTIGYLLLGVGGWLAFMAKPSTAAALSVGVAVYLVVARKVNGKRISMAVALAIVLLSFSAILIDGSLAKFARRIAVGIEYLGYLGGGHTFNEIMRLDRFQLTDHESVMLVVLGTVSFFVAICIAADRLSLRSVGLIGACAGFVLVFATILNVSGLSVGMGQFRALTMLAIPAAAVMVAVVLFGRKLLSCRGSCSWLLALVLAVMPHAYAFGTNGNYWFSGSSAGFFWVAAGLVLVAPVVKNGRSWAALVPLSIATELITVLLLQTGIEHPYRQDQPLLSNANPVQVGAPGSDVVVSSAYAEYINDAVLAAKTQGFRENMPLIDLTGQSPGLLYALNAKSVGQAWMIGGYPGSEKLAAAALTHANCADIDSAWLLVEPEGPRRIPPEMLLSQGRDVYRDYEVVAEWMTPEYSGGYRQSRLQRLLKPIPKSNESGRNCPG